MNNLKYTTFITTTDFNNMYYIGAHQTYNIYDNYLGSGKLIKRSIKKYGKSKFSKLVAGVWRSKEIMFLMESVIVDSEVVSDKLSYNLKIGGQGGNEDQIKIDIDNLKELLKTMQVSDVSRSLGVTPHTIWKRIKDYDLDYLTHTDKYSPIDVEWLSEELKTKSIPQISRDGNISQKRLRTLIKKEGISTKRINSFKGLRDGMDVKWLQNELITKSSKMIAVELGITYKMMMEIVLFHSLKNIQVFSIVVDPLYLINECETKTYKEVSKSLGISEDIVGRMYFYFRDSLLSLQYQLVTNRTAKKRYL